MTPDADLAIVRRAFAKQILHAAGSDDPRLEHALAETRREDFLGPGPWSIMRMPGGYQETPDADPVFLYQDTPVSLVRDKQLNNGQPSFLAMLIGLCAAREGDSAVHVGTGTGYYTALMSRLVGASGQVLGIEIEPDLARKAARDLRSFANTTIVEGDGWTLSLDPRDAILVNAGTPRIATTWLDALKPGGRLVVPLATRIELEGRLMTRGAIFLITRDADGFAASVSWSTVIYPCQGASDPESEAALAAAFENGNVGEVTRLRREQVDGKRCWLRGEGWSLTYD